MAETLDDGAFWLPSNFLTDDDLLIDKENINRDSISAGFGQNSLRFSRFGSSLPLHSRVSSAVTEAGQEEFLVKLARQLAQSSLQENQKFNPSHTFTRDNAPEKLWVLSTSPQSTLSGIGGWPSRSGDVSCKVPSRVPSPSEAQHDARDLINAAAGKVARLQFNTHAQTNQQNMALFGAPGKSSSLVPKCPNISSSAWGRCKVPNTMTHPPTVEKGALHSNQTAVSYNFPRASQALQLGQARHEIKQQGHIEICGRQGREGWHCQHCLQQKMRTRCGGGHGAAVGGALGLPQSAWPLLEIQHHHHQRAQSSGGSSMIGGFLGTSGARRQRQSTGTGVFLPRRFEAPEPRKKPAVLLPARVVQALHLNLEELDVHPQPTFVPDHDALMARRSAIWAPQS
ncbi:hypothetical protein Nepgr_017222 [Nepenthes gracilis]|uniref:Uncharacterized protein n=1 Tax=Nepenthes gracilis TaxID=150966 RepID=A0AAD3SS56_NEPGR|nr:hypothetical protein Nepgr_017222 [Nepenthes gracilis]